LQTPIPIQRLKLVQHAVVAFFDQCQRKFSLLLTDAQNKSRLL